MNFEQQLEQKLQEIEGILRFYLPAEKGCQKTVIEAMNYSILAGGKRLRPMFMKEVYALFGGDKTEIEPFLAAIEMIHTYSLVHDDLPAMDNDEYRRGIKTTHVVYGEAMAVLAGDGLLNLAFETMAKAFDMTQNAERVGRAIAVIAQKSGIYGMIGGQTVDIEFENKPIDKEMLTLLHRLKTGALIEASMMAGAILAGASKEEVEKLSRIALDIGLAFQIQDDILDVTSSTEVLGKPVHSDEKNNKTTYVGLEGLERAKEEVKLLSDRAVSALNEFPEQNEFLAELIRRLVFREK